MYTATPRPKQSDGAQPTSADYSGGQFDYEEKGVNKHFRKEGAVDNLAALADEFAKIPKERFNKEATEQALRSLAEKRELKVAQLIHPLRLALTGTTKGPGMFEITDILGKEPCLKRIERAIDYINNLDPI